MDDRGLEGRTKVVVDRALFVQLARALRARVAVSIALDGPRVVHAIPSESLTDVEARLLWEPYRWGRRDLDPLLVRMNGDLGEILTLRREDLLRDRDWYINPLVGDYFGPLRLDHAMYSEVRLTPTLLHRFGFTRSRGDAPFSDFDRAMLHMYHQRLVAALRGSLEGDLSARARAVLEGLRRGESEKEIASRLEVKQATVHREILSLYRRFGVRRHAELLIATGAGTGDAEVQRRVDALSPRERQALALLSSGMSEREISCFMGISNHTLHGYVKTLYRLFQANSRPELLVQIGDLRVPIE